MVSKTRFTKRGAFLPWVLWTKARFPRGPCDLQPETGTLSFLGASASPMHPSKPSGFEPSSFRRRGMVLAAATLTLLASLPFASGLWDAARYHHPLAFRVVTAVLIPAAVLAFLLRCVPYRRWKDPLFYAWSSCLLAAYIPVLIVFCEYPAERFHALTYGVLAVLTYWWLAPRVPGLRIYVGVVVYGLAVGTLDEGIQALLPNRVGEIRDMAVNWVSTVLGAGLVIGATWPERTQAPALRHRLRRMGWTGVLLMGMGYGAACYLATG